jgi:hypothetical protein
MGDVSEYMIKKLATQFPLPKGAQDSIAEWMRDYVEALEGYTDSLLSLAAKNIIKTRESRSFPLVAECVKACRDTLEAMAEPDLKKPVRDRHPEWSDERRRSADRLFACAMGRDAVKEGWSWALWDWLRENGRHPTSAEADRIRKRGMANTRRFWEAMNNPPKPVNPQLGISPSSFIKWHNAVHTRLRKLVETV